MNWEKKERVMPKLRVGPPREAHRMTNKEPGHLRIELPSFNVLNCKHLRDIIFQIPQVRKRQSHIQLRKILVQPCIEVVDREFRIALAWTQFFLGNSAQTIINAGKDGRSYGYSLSLHQAMTNVSGRMTLLRLFGRTKSGSTREPRMRLSRLT